MTGQQYENQNEFVEIRDKSNDIDKIKNVCIIVFLLALFIFMITVASIAHMSGVNLACLFIVIGFLLEIILG